VRYRRIQITLVIFEKRALILQFLRCMRNQGIYSE